MKLKIQVSIVYPDTPPTETRSYPTRNEQDIYEQTTEISDESVAKVRLSEIIRAFNAFEK